MSGRHPHLCPSHTSAQGRGLTGHVVGSVARAPTAGWACPPPPCPWQSSPVFTKGGSVVQASDMPIPVPPPHHAEPVQYKLRCDMVTKNGDSGALVGICQAQRPSPPGWRRGSHRRDIIIIIIQRGQDGNCRHRPAPNLQPSCVPGPGPGTGDIDESDGAVPRALSLVVTTAKEMDGGSLVRYFVERTSMGICLVFFSILLLSVFNDEICCRFRFRARLGPGSSASSYFLVKLHLRR